MVLSLLVFLSTTLFVLLVVCLMVLVNCLLNAFAICLCVAAVLLLKGGLLVRVVSLSDFLSDVFWQKLTCTIYACCLFVVLCW